MAQRDYVLRPISALISLIHLDEPLIEGVLWHCVKPDLP